MAVFLGSIYYGREVIDWVVYRGADHWIGLDKGATRITESHFRQPEQCIFDKNSLDLFLENVTRHKGGILGWKPFYVVLLGLYLALACVVIVKVINTETDELPNVET